MLLSTSPHFVCSHCGEELRFLEGTTVPLSDMAVMQNVHHCHRRHWVNDVANAMKEYRVSQLYSHPRLYRTMDGQTHFPIDVVANGLFSD